MLVDQPQFNIKWLDGKTPYSIQYNDYYFDQTNGFEESVFVFLNGNSLPVRFTSGFHIAELGFGTGLNMLVALQSWRQCKLMGPLKFTSFEKYPLSTDDMSKALSQFDTITPLVDELLEAWHPEQQTIELRSLILEVIVGDARVTLPSWSGKADAWFLDGFSPARNPELWESTLLTAVAKHTSRDGTFATYSSAGKVRRALADAGFVVKRCPGYGRKRHMCCGKLKDAY